MFPLSSRAGATADVPDQAAPTRRTVVGLVGATVGAAVLSGCGVRWDRREADLPLLAPRAVDPRAVAVYAELRRVRAARAEASTAAGTAANTAAGIAAGIAATLERLHRLQDGVLSARLTELGEDPGDTKRLDAALATAPIGIRGTPAPTPAAGSSAAPVGLAVAEAAGLSAAELHVLDALPPGEAPLLLSLRVQRAVALPLVGGTAPVWATPMIASAGEAARLVGVFRSAEYGLRVAAARTVGATRTRLTGPLGWVGAARLVLEQQAGVTPTAVPPGYALPFPVTDDVSAVKLAQTVLTGVTDGVLTGTPAAAGSASGLLAVLTLAAVTESHARDLGAELRAFPGLASGSTPTGR